MLESLETTAVQVQPSHCGKPAVGLREEYKVVSG